MGAFALLSILMLFSWNSSKVDAAATPTTVVVNPGHGGISSSGGSDPGAVSNGYKEVDLNNALAIKTVLTLRASGYNAMLSHPVPGSGSIPTLLATAPTMDNYSATISAAADKIGADLIIAIHHNSDGGFGGHGYEFYWSSYHPGIPDGKDGLYEVYGLWANPGDEPTIRDAVLCEAAEKSKELANSFNENFKSLDYITSRDKITERDDAITRLPNMPSVLIEAGFVSNSAEVQQLADGNNQQKMADQILKSVNSIFGTVIEPMTASGVTATVSGNLINVSIKGISAPNGIKQIQVPVWSDINGQDDIKWYAASAQSDGSYSVTIDSKDHNYDGGIYNVHCYGTDNNGKMVMLGNTTVNVKADSMTATSLTASVTGGKISATVKGITAPNGIRSITLPVWSDVGGQDDIKWYVASAQSDGSYSVTIDSKDHNYDDGIYNVHCYGTDNNGKMVMLGNTTVEVEAKTLIMGTTSVTTEQIVDYYESSGKVFPQYYIDRGVNLETFVNMYIQESESEGVRAEVAFAQAMLETGYLQFSGDVKIGQFNFAGFGATGGVPGYDFAAIYGDSRVGIQTGIRAHIQHLKCYASDLPLNQVKVDPRWGEWIRLRATTVEALSGTWATDTQYATKILNIINRF